MHVIGRRELLTSAAALVLVGCGGGSGGPGITEDDVVLGQENAPVTIVEYASTTCPHCATFHNTVWEELKTNYIDTGRVRFVFREFPTQPAQVAAAGFQLARCGGASPEQYFNRIGELFRRQGDMLGPGATPETVRTDLLDIGDAVGLSQQQVLECIGDSDAVAQRIGRITEGARDLGVDSTPTFIINGRRFEQAPTYENMSRAIDAAIAG